MMKAILFDMDGLMVDTERLYIETESELARSYGKELQEETIFKMMGKKPTEAMEVFIRDLELEVPANDLLQIRDGMFEERLRKDLVPMAGLFEMLGEYKNTLKMGIATGSARKFAEMILTQLKIDEFFSVICTSNEVANGKPDPEIYLKVMEKLGVLPEECIVLEDSRNGALAGKKAGCYTIAVPSEYTCGLDFSFVDYEATDLHDARMHIREKFFG